MKNGLALTVLLVSVLEAANIHARNIPDGYTIDRDDNVKQSRTTTGGGESISSLHLEDGEVGEDLTKNHDKPKPLQFHVSRDATSIPVDEPKPGTAHNVRKSYDGKYSTQEGQRILRKDPHIFMTRTHTRGNGSGDVSRSGFKNDNVFSDLDDKVKNKIPHLNSAEDNEDDNDGRFIVKFVDDASLDHSRRLQENGGHVGTVINTIEKDLIQVMKLTPEEVIEWNDQETVQYVEADRKIRLLGNSYIYDEYPNELVPYGIRLVRALDVSDDYVSNQKVCIIDSGYLLSHPDLPKTSIITGTVGSIDTPWFMDECGHGTHVAGTIAALGGNEVGVVGVVRSGAMPLHIVRVFGDNDNGCEWTWASTLIAAVEECVDAGSNIVNLSLGGPSSTYFEEEIYDRLLRDDDVLVVAAGGNDGGNEYFFPASYSSVMSVAAVDENKNRVGDDFNYNDRMDIAAPGKSILSTLPGGYGSFTGTSMAAPHVAGIAALVWSHFPSLSAVDIRSALEVTAEDIGSDGEDDYFGHGLIDALAAFKYLEKTFSNVPTLSPVPSASPSISAMPTACGNGFCDLLDVSLQETCSNCPIDCSIIQHCNGAGFLLEPNGMFFFADWHGVAFKVKTLKNVSFYEIIARVNIVKGESTSVKLYTKHGDFTGGKGMGQWTLVFDGQIMIQDDYQVVIPIKNSLKTDEDMERSFYIAYPTGNIILFRNHTQNYGLSFENNDVKIYRGEAQDGEFGTGIYNYVSFSGILMYTNDFGFSPHPSPAPSLAKSNVPTSVSSRPSQAPTSVPSQTVSTKPSSAPNAKPSAQPSREPSLRPSLGPSVSPSKGLSDHPSLPPSGEPSMAVSSRPSGEPSTKPSFSTSNGPSRTSSIKPSTGPTSSEQSAQPSWKPTRQPSQDPSVGPSKVLSTQPPSGPNGEPSILPSTWTSWKPSIQQSSLVPSHSTSEIPSNEPTTLHTSPIPSNIPSTWTSSRDNTLKPSSQPSAELSIAMSKVPSSLEPSILPSISSSHEPSASPTLQPSQLLPHQTSSGPSVETSKTLSAQPSWNQTSLDVKSSNNTSMEPTSTAGGTSNSSDSTFSSGSISAPLPSVIILSFVIQAILYLA